jgi:hypothetical protein
MESLRIGKVGFTSSAQNSFLSFDYDYVSTINLSINKLVNSFVKCVSFRRPIN